MGLCTAMGDNQPLRLDTAVGRDGNGNEDGDGNRNGMGLGAATEPLLGR